MIARHARRGGAANRLSRLDFGDSGDGYDLAPVEPCVPAFRVFLQCRFVERILTVVQTRRLQGRPVLDYLYEALVAHRTGLPAPKLL